MVSLGGARPPKSETILTRDVDAFPGPTRVRTFRPPAPKWQPIPFVGPPLEPSDSPTADGQRNKGVFVPMPIVIAAAAGFVIIAVAVIYALI